MNGGASITINLDLNALAQRTLATRPAAIHVALEHVAEASAAQTPKDSEDLVKSQRVTPEAEITDSGSIHYDGPYARYQHEKLDLEHPVGNAKYLERPFQEEAAQAKKLVAHRIAGAI